MLIFGFDIGTTSVGFAVINIDEPSTKGDIVRLGVRIFPEARDPDGTPLNQQRRNKRMMRHQLRRRRERRKGLNQTLVAAGLLPAFSDQGWVRTMANDPYALRKRGLSEPLTEYEVGRAIYHLAKRRHFKGRDLEENISDAEKSSDEKEAKNNRDTTLMALKANGSTLGQWLAEKPIGKRKRGIHATREIVANEFEQLWSTQAPHHPVLRDPDFKAQITEAIFAQRPVFWRKNTLGHCRLEPDAALCPKGSWLSQQRRMLEKLNNLAVAGGNARPLDTQEREAILAKLQIQASMSWAGVRRALEPLFEARGESAKAIKFNLEIGGDRSLMGNSLEAKFADIFGTDWQKHPYKGDLRREVQARLWAADYGEIGTQRVVIRSEADRRAKRRVARTSFISDFHVTEAQADALAELKFPQGWEPYSTVAIEKILPELEKGVRFGSLISSPEWETWRSTNFPNRAKPTGEFYDRLPTPRDPEEARRIVQLRNPTVVRAQNELRKVVNNLIGLYGKPDLIRVELARDVGKSKREREEISVTNRKQEKRRKEAIADLKSNDIDLPSRDDVEKWLLWKEGLERCPYTGDQICFDDLFRNGRYQVEHIWPRSRSLDNGFRNKTLCRTDINNAKGNKTPFEHFEHRPDDWQAIKNRLDRMMGTKEGISPGKIKRFLAESIPEDFTNRQLNDTSYAARQAVAFLKKLWPDLGPEAPVKVQCVSGRVTAQLRKRWGLNNILADDGEKTRADHRHHAVDALAVACANAGFVKRLADYFKDEERKLKPSLSLPWPTIRQDATIAIEKIVVSHRVRKKVSGPLHDEMPFGYTKRTIIKNGVELGVYVKRMPVERLSLETLKINRVEDISRTAKFVISDGGVREALKMHLQSTNKDAAKAYPPYPRLKSKKNQADSQEIRKVRVLTTQQKELMVPAANGFVDPANNHHIAVWRRGDDEADYRTVSLFEAAMRLSRRQPIVQRNHPDGLAFVMSLSAGDAVAITDGDKKGIWIVQGMWANGQVVLVRHSDARPTSKKEADRLHIAGVREEFLPKVSGLLQRKAKKVSIDPIGRVHPAHD